MENYPIEKELPAITDDEYRRMQGFVIKDQIDMIAVNNRILEVRAVIKQINEFFDFVGMDGLKHGVWRDQKTSLDNTKKRWDEAVKRPNMLFELLDKKQKEFIESERRKVKEQEELIRKQLEQQAYEKQEEEALDLIFDGKPEEAEAVKSRPVTAPVVNLKTEALIPGLHTRKNWKWECVDFDSVPGEYKKLVLDEDKLTKIAKEREEKAEISGIKFFNDFSPIRRQR
jgi:hypothetical protein